MKRYVTLFIIMLVVLSFCALPAFAQKPIRIGVLATLTGAFAELGQDSVDGVKLAFEEVDYKVAGRPIKLYIEDTAATPTLAVDKCRALINRDRCSIVLGPLSGAEGLAIKKSADEWPNATIIVAASAAENVCRRGIKPNIWRTSFSGDQPMFPLGIYAYDHGFRRVITIGEDYAFPYAHVGGFLKTFIDMGGCVSEKYWVPIGTSDYASIITDMPKDADCIYLSLSGSDVISFLTQMDKFGMMGKYEIFGGATSIDAGTLTTMGDVVKGIVSGSIWTGEIDSAAFRSLDKRYHDLRGRPVGLFCGLYYRAAEVAMLGIEGCGGKPEDVRAFRQALGRVKYDGAVSHIEFDEYQQAKMDVFINEVRYLRGEWRNAIVKTYKNVSQFWDFDPDEFQKQPSYSRDFPDKPCR
ncbi:MAG: ABC transporter substrate-binding protein [Spirochaetota bacterium]|nr:MAG: ABC transporter substrate-binding protein [Spirochaetota bacterium]